MWSAQGASKDSTCIRAARYRAQPVSADAFRNADHSRCRAHGSFVQLARSGLEDTRQSRLVRRDAQLLLRKSRCRATCVSGQPYRTTITHGDNTSIKCQDKPVRVCAQEQRPPITHCPQSLSTNYSGPICNHLGRRMTHVCAWSKQVSRSVVDSARFKTAYSSTFTSVRFIA